MTPTGCRDELYAGLWYHLAATLGSYQMPLYVDGVLASPPQMGPASVGDSSAVTLRLGQDPDGPTHFRGLVDKFRLYKTAFTQDAIRGLRWFGPGSDSIIVPRGVLYDSLLFAKMTNTSSDVMPGPLARATVRTNTNNGSAHLNAQVRRTGRCLRERFRA